MRDTGLIRAKEDAIYEVYKRGLVEGKFRSFRDAGDWVCKQPAPKFFIDSRTASLLIGKVLAGQSIHNMHSSSRRLVRQLHRNYVQFMEDNPGCTLSRDRVMELLVDEPAPEFYLTGDATRRILRKAIKRVRERWNR